MFTKKENLKTLEQQLLEQTGFQPIRFDDFSDHDHDRVAQMQKLNRIPSLIRQLIQEDSRSSVEKSVDAAWERFCG